MAIYTDTMFNLSGAAVTTLTEMSAGIGTTAGKYSAPLNGRLVKVTITLVPQAATSLAQHGRLHLTQSNWTPNVHRYWCAGFGLATAPQLYGGTQAAHEYVTDLQVRTDWPITGEAVYPGTGPVTPTMIVTGTFVSGG